MNIVLKSRGNRVRILGFSRNRNIVSIEVGIKKGWCRWRKVFGW